MPPTPDAQIRRGQKAERVQRGHTEEITQLKIQLRQAQADITEMQPTVSHVPGHERGLKRLSAKIRTLQSGLDELLRREAGVQSPSPALTAAWQKEFNRLQQEVQGYFGDLDTQMAAIRTSVDAVKDRVGVIENSRGQQIDFDASTYVPVRGRVTAHIDWLSALLVGVVAGVVTGVLTNIYVEEWKDSYVIAAGVIVGVAVFLLWSSFERLTFRGEGQITWINRETMQEQADELARETAGQLPPPPPPPVERTSVQPAIPHDAKV